MRSLAVLGLVALLAVGCTSAGSELVEATGPAGPFEPDETAEPSEPDEPPPDLCAVWAEGNEIDQIYMRAQWSSDLDDDVITAWISPLYTAVIDDLLAVLPEGYELLAVYFTAQIELLSEDSTATPADLEEKILEETGIDVDELTDLAEELFDEIEAACGPVVELEPVEIEDPGEVPDHIRRVVHELRIDRLVGCLTSPSSVDLFTSLLDRSADSEPLIGLASDCGANEAEAELFAWRVTDIEWYWGGFVDDLDDVILQPELVPRAEDHDELAERLAEQRGGSELAEPEPTVSPSPEVNTYPVEGLVADVLGTFGIVGDDAACLVEAGVYEPASLWLDEPGVNPDVLAQQRALLDEVAAACGYGTDDVDEWLGLAHQYVTEVAAYE